MYSVPALQREDFVTICDISVVLKCIRLERETAVLRLRQSATTHFEACEQSLYTHSSAKESSLSGDVGVLSGDSFSMPGVNVALLNFRADDWLPLSAATDVADEPLFT